MLIPLLASVYPHYYSWWSYFNYWNDDFYFQWNHQLFFSITELISTIVVILMCDSSRPLHPLELLAVIDIAIVHIITSSGDQFWTNIIRNRGMWHQRVRDLGFMVPDLINVFVPAFFLWQLASQKRMPIVKMIGGQYGFGLSFLCIGFLCVLCWNLWTHRTFLLTPLVVHTNHLANHDSRISLLVILFISFTCYLAVYS